MVFQTRNRWIEFHGLPSLRHHQRAGATCPSTRQRRNPTTSSPNRAGVAQTPVVARAQHTTCVAAVMVAGCERCVYWDRSVCPLFCFILVETCRCRIHFRALASVHGVRECIARPSPSVQRQFHSSGVGKAFSIFNQCHCLEKKERRQERDVEAWKEGLEPKWLRKIRK